MGTPDIQVTPDTVIRIEQRFREDVIVTNVGVNIAYLDTQSAVSRFAYDFQLRPGERVVWKAGLEMYAISEPTGPTFLSVAHGGSEPSSAGIGAGANQTNVMFEGYWPLAETDPITNDPVIYDCRRYTSVQIATAPGESVNPNYQLQLYWLIHEDDPNTYIALDTYNYFQDADFHIMVDVKAPFMRIHWIGGT